MFAMISMGIALALVPILLPSNEIYGFSEIGSSVYSLLRTTSSAVVIVICVYLVHYKRKTKKYGNWPGQSETTDCEHKGFWLSKIGFGETQSSTQAKYMLFTVVVFGICSIIRIILQLFIDVKYLSERLLAPYLDHITDIVAVCSQMIFFFYYHGGALPNVHRLHYSIAFLIGIQVCSWISVSLEPFWGLDKEESAHNISQDLEFSDTFFETFYTEFYTVAISILFYIWHSMERLEKPKSKMEKEIPISETVPLLDDYDPERSVGGNVKFHRENREKIIVAIVSISLALVYVTTDILATRDQVFPGFADRIYIYRATALIYFSGLSLFAILQLSRIRTKSDIVLPIFNSSEYILLFTACSETMYYFLRGVSAIGYFLSHDVTPSPTYQTYTCSLLHEHNENEASVDNIMASVFLAYSIIAITNGWVQTTLLLVVRRKRVSKRFKLFLILFACFNFAEWLQSAIRLGLRRKEEDPTLTPLMNWFFSSDKARIVVLALLPTMLLFRFHSGIVCLELVHEA